MKIIRQGVFETNSSSCHSITLKRVVPNLQKPILQGKVITINPETWYKYSGEPCEERVFTSFEDKLNYILASVWSYFYSGNSYYSEVSKEYKDYTVKLSTDIDPTYQEQFQFFKGKEGKDVARFTVSRLGYVGALYVSDLLDFLEKETGASFRLQNGCEKLEYGGIEFQEKKVPRGVFQYARMESEWECYSEFEFPFSLDTPIPLPKLYHRGWVEYFLFSDSVKIRIASTSSNNPLDPEIFEDSHGAYEDENIVKVLKDYEVFVDGLSNELGSEGRVQYKNLNRPFNNIK